MEVRARGIRREVAAFDQLSPALRERIAFSPVAFIAEKVLRQVNELADRLCAPPSFVMEMMAEQFDAAEVSAFVDVCEKIREKTGYVLPHVLAGVSLMQTRKI